VGALHRQAEVGHDQLDRRLAHLREDDEVDVSKGEPGIPGQLAHQARPPSWLISGG